jgi:hypothetical protein
MMTDPLRGLATNGHPKSWVTLVKIECVLAEVGELLAILTIKLGSATVEEMPALIDKANQTARLVLRCCLASDPASHFSPEEAAMLRAELVRLGEALEAQIAGIIRLAQLAGGTTSATRH